MSDKNKMVMAVFRDRYDAERAFDYLHAKGYLNSEINVLMSDKTRATFATATEKKEDKHKSATKAPEGMAVGGAVGTAVGATLGALLTIGATIAIPGIGVVAGPIVAALAGGGAGAVAGGLVGTLIGAGIPEQNAQAYEEALRNGGVALGVVPHNNDHASDIQKTFKDYNGENVCYC